MGSEHHVVCLLDATGGERDERRVAHTATEVNACLDWILARTNAPPSAITVAIETPRGALVDACLARELTVYAVNLKQLDRFRDRHTVAGAKDDRRDALVLADSLRTDAVVFQRVTPSDPIVVQLRELSRAEDDLDAEFRRLAISSAARSIASAELLAIQNSGLERQPRAIARGAAVPRTTVVTVDGGGAVSRRIAPP